MSADTLLSTLAQYPFPDSREIARGAGRADFIQPSLGPLQPNFDDLMDLDLDFLNFPRLPPVPEEGSEDILKAIEYNYPSGSNQMNSSGSIQEITNAQVALSQQIPSNRPSGGTNSVITGPVTSMSVGQSQQQQQQQQPSPATIHYSAKVFSQNLNPGGGNANSSVQQQQQQLNNVLGSYLATQIQGQLVSANVPANTNPSEQQPQQIGLLVGTDELGKESKPKFSRAFPKILGREPHNYDKCQPTTHQTMAYNMVSQPNLSQNILQNPYGYQLPQGGIIQMSGTPANQNLLNYNLLQQSQSAGANPMNLSNTGIIGASNLQAMNAKLLTHSQSLPVQQNQQPTLQKPQPRSNSMPVAQNYPPISPPGGIQEPYKGSLHPTQTSSYKSYHNHQPQPYKIPSQTIGGYGGGSRSMRHASPPHGHQVQATAVQQQQQQQQQPQQPCLEQSQQQLQDLQLQQQQQQHQQTSPQQKRLPPHPTKEMFRSNSLPINATFPLPPKNEENFAVPRLQSAKSPHPAKLRGRSNSMIIKQQQQQQQQQQMGGGGISGTNLLPALHSTTSEPVLNVGTSALLAQLLTTTSASTLLNMKQHSSSSSAISSLSSPQQQQSHQSHIAQQPKQQPQMCQQVSLGSPISPTSSQMQLNLSSSQQQQPHSSVLTFAASTSSAGSSGLSSESMALDLDSPMLGIEGNSNSSSGSGVGNKFHQQQARSESQRRSGHIHAEQKRRYNIKNGFDMLHSLIPQLQQNPNAKLSKAAMLQKGAEYIKQLRVERSATNEKMDALRREIDTLNNSLNNLQTALPASGAPVSRQRTGRVKELYQQYVRQRTLDNWKFWIFGLIFEPLMNTFNQTVSVASLDEMCRSSQLWVDQHCSLVELRPAVSNKLRQLSTTTDILSDPPTSLQEEVMKAVATTMPPLPGSSSSSRCGSNANSPKQGSSGMQTEPPSY
uniref:Putative mlx interactor n=1 Tax=Culex tarsalis TaxID=7177 RepID=A0A1Q3FDZ9_CULTA